MKQAYSLNMVNSDGKIDIDSLTSIPPGCQKFKINAILTLHLKIQYINKTNSNLLFKTKIWGRQEQELTFRKVGDDEAILNLTVRSSIENASRYFSDMGVICIQCYISGKDEQKMPLKSKEYTHFGRIYITIKRYIVNFLLCDFQENFAILDHRKTKIGEVIGKLTFQQPRKDNFYPIATEPQIRHERLQSANISIRPSHDYEPNQTSKIHERKDSFQPSQLAERRVACPIGRNSIDDQDGKRNTVIQYISRPESNQEDFAWKTDRRKGKAAQFLQEYNKTKPQHTQLSMIRAKYGLNCPSIQVMKLKYDEALLLSNHEKTAFEDGARMNLLLKYIKNNAKNALDSLIINYHQSQSALKTETKIILNEQINSKIDINYLYVLQKIKGEDFLTFEIKDAKIQLSIAELKGKNMIDFKGKNGKKMASLEFSFIEQQFIPAPSNIPVKQDNQQDTTKQNLQLVKVKEHCFLKVEGWPNGHVVLRNKKIGNVNGPKIMYELQKEDHSFVEVQLQSSRGKQYLRVDINHLLKQQNFVVDGRQVKIITAKGELSDLLALISKINSPSNIKQKSQKSQENNVDIKDTVNVLQALEKCENYQCNQLIQSLSKQLNTKKLSKLSKLIGVNPEAFENVITSVFHGNFDKFSKTFLTYHNWNHRYLSSQRNVQKIIQNNLFNNDLQKTVKRLKRSSEVVFGIISSTAFIKEFLKSSERVVTQQTQSEFNQEQFAKLIVLLLERYPTKCIKLSQLQSFINKNHNYFNLNAYLLFKISHQIINDSQSFEESLNESDWELIQVMKDDCEGQWGLAKLLLTHQDEISNSSISDPGIQRNATEPNPINQQGHIQTEFSNKEQQKKPQTEQAQRLETEHERRQQITLILSSIQVNSVDSIQEIQIFSQYEGIKLSHNQIIFPKAIELLKNTTNTVVVKTIHDTFEGVFIANLRSQSVKLFSNGVEAGVLEIFNKTKKEEGNHEDDQIIVRIEDTEINHLPHLNEQFQMQIQQQMEVKCITPVAKSPYIRLTIRSIRPTRSNYKLMLSSELERQSLNFPNQNQILLKNHRDGWKIRMIDQQIEDVVVTNHITSNPYCFLDKRDQRVLFTAVIEVEECWDPQLALGLKQSLHLIIHFDELISIKNIDKGDYSLIIECSPQIPNISLHHHASSNIMNIYQSVIAPSPPERVTVKLVNSTLKEQIAEFKFALKLIDEGIAKSTRYLLSNMKGYRLKITIFQVRHSWEYCKPDRVLSLFNSENRRIIQSWIHSIADVTEQQLIVWLKANFQLALSQITILLEELLSKFSRSSVQTFLDTFKKSQKTYVKQLNEIRDEFTVFDYNDEGVVNEDQLRIAKKVFNRSFKTFYSFLLNNQNAFIPSPQLPNNFIIDLSSAIKSNYFDYLSFLDLMDSRSESNDINKKKKEKSEYDEQKKIHEKGSYLSIRIIQFQNLSINKLPCTFLFKINDQNLAEPIHKCYTFKYCTSNEIIVPFKPPPQLQIYLQSLKSNGFWDFKLLQTLTISEQVKVFGGCIKFALQYTGEKIPQNHRENSKRQQFPNENHDSNGNKYHHDVSNNTSPKKNQQMQRSFSESMSKQFSKSIWNKSLNETRQKWSQWKQNRKGQQQIKKQIIFDEKVQNNDEQY